MIYNAMIKKNHIENTSGKSTEFFNDFYLRKNYSVNRLSIIKKILLLKLNLVKILYILIKTLLK